MNELLLKMDDSVVGDFARYSTFYGGDGVLTLPDERPDSETGQILKITGDSTNTVTWDHAISDSLLPTVDWTGKILRFQISIDFNTVAASDITLFVESVNGPWTYRTSYEMGEPLNSAANGKFTRFDVDIDTEATGFTLGPADLGRLVRWGFIVVSPGVGATLKWGEFTLIDRNKQPRLVEIVDYQRFQDNPAPAATGPTFSISMRMLEVTN